ncbi:hypothetical protein OSTOST_11816, partial [Ostertagia ostertagi]
MSKPPKEERQKKTMRKKCARHWRRQRTADHIRILSSTFTWEDFVKQFTSSMELVASNTKFIDKSLSLDAIHKLPPLLVSSLFENSLVMDEAIQDCSKSAVFQFYIEDSASSVVINVVGTDVDKANMISLLIPANDDIDVTKNTIYIDRNTVSLAIDATKLNHLGVAWSLTVKTTTGSCYVQ